MAPQAAHGHLTFIDISFTEPQSEDLRGTISRHIQGYRRKKKQEGARRLLQSSKFLQYSTELQATTVDESQSRSTTGYEQPALRATPRPIVLPSLMSILLLAPDVSSATLTNLLGFERSCVHVAMQKMEFQVTRSTFQYSPAWFEDTKAYLYDNLTVFSYLSRIAATFHMVTNSGSYRIMALDFRNRAITALRKYFEETVNPDVERLYRAFVILVLAESALGDRMALEAHVKILRHLVQACGRRTTSDPLIGLREFLTIIYQDVQIAVLNMTNTFFDIRRDGWIDQHFQPLWRGQLENWVAYDLEANVPLNPQIHGVLRRLYFELRASLRMVIELRRHNTLSLPQHTYLRVFSQAVFLLGRLMNYYATLRCEHVLDVSFYSDPATVIHVREKAMATLCAVYWLRESFGIESVFLSDNLRIFTANRVILAKLKDLVESVYFDESDLDESDEDQSLDIKLWALFTGISVENTYSNIKFQSTLLDVTGRGLPEHQPWFMDKLWSVLRVENLTWDQVRARLETFLVLEHLEVLCDLSLR